LRKEPLERYLTVEQLSSEIQAYLDGRPVAARQGTLRYRVAKFMRRNRLGVAGAALLAATLAAGVAGVLWQSPGCQPGATKGRGSIRGLEAIEQQLVV
jgi:hypothetical protein